MDARIAQAVLDGDCERAVAIALDKMPDFYAGGSDCLKVAWVTKGEKFRIDEYDGAETVVVLSEISSFTA
jgi:hypothetical protein